MAERLDLDGHAGNLDPVEDWRRLDDAALAAALSARGVNDGVLDTILARVHEHDAYVEVVLDRYFDNNP